VRSAVYNGGVTIRASLALLLGLGGCRSLLGVEDPILVDSGTGGDGVVTDADPDAPPGALCLGAGEFRVCVPPPTQPFAVTGATNTGLDTDDPNSGCTPVSQGTRPDLCVIAATTITIDANILFAQGSHPFVLFAADTIQIGSGVDVGSHAQGQALGAGADSAACNPSTDGGSDVNGAGGGGGGSLGSKGGNGGDSDGANGGAAAVASPPSPFLRGGCRGADGGDGSTGSGGAGFHGGGAVLLLAGTSISIAGFVNASGGGGTRGIGSKGGGGGGGSGGMIAMSAPAITVTGKLMANGGGGGGGANSSNDGNDGSDPNIANPTSPASGGQGGGGAAGKGANGAAGNTAAANAQNASEGAGGGGGGVGEIRILSGQTISGTSSPMASSF
jgi:hypothetical protein